MLKSTGNSTVTGHSIIGEFTQPRKVSPDGTICRNVGTLMHHHVSDHVN